MMQCECSGLSHPTCLSLDQWDEANKMREKKENELGRLVLVRNRDCTAPLETHHEIIWTDKLFQLVVCHDEIL